MVSSHRKLFKRCGWPPAWQHHTDRHHVSPWALVAGQPILPSRFSCSAHRRFLPLALLWTKTVRHLKMLGTYQSSSERCNSSRQKQAWRLPQWNWSQDTSVRVSLGLPLLLRDLLLSITQTLGFKNDIRTKVNTETLDNKKSEQRPRVMLLERRSQSRDLSRKSAQSRGDTQGLFLVLV